MKKRMAAVVLVLVLIFSMFSVVPVNALQDNSDTVYETVSVTKNNKVLKEFDSEGELVESDGNLTFKLDVKKTGKYFLDVVYRQDTFQFSEIELNLNVNGNAYKSSLKHVWIYSDDVTYDIQGNQIMPPQSISEKTFTERVYTDIYYITPLVLNLDSGINTISLTTIDESVYICDVKLVPQYEAGSYAEYLEANKNKADNVSADALKEYEAEDSALRSDKSIMMQNDRNSVIVKPYDAAAVRYNTLGGSNWSTPGSWVEWDITVEESGFYNITTYAKQNFKLNDNSYRSLYINGELPFAEAKNIVFQYDRNWNNVTFGNGEEAYKFYFEAGKTYTIRLASTVGTYSYIVERVADLVKRLNDDYLNILMLTGSVPDPYRDYQFEKTIPETLSDLEAVGKELKEVEKEWLTYAEGGASLSAIQQMYQLIDDINEDHKTLVNRLTLLNSYTSSLSTWVNDRRAQPLELDCIKIHSAQNDDIDEGTPFFKVILHHIIQFVQSYMMDYSSVGNVYENSDDAITVWLGSDAGLGRDQAQVITSLISNDFIKNTGIPVKAQLVTAGSLLPSILAEIGPDVALGLGSTTPVNYALRNAIVDLSELEGIDEVLMEFNSAAYEPFKLNGGLYALPENQSWSMLFYRTDILEELGIKEESLKTWDGIVVDVLPMLQIRFLDFGFPTGMNMYLDLLYQKGGKLYSDDHMNLEIDSVEGIEAFTYLTNMFLEKGSPVAYSFLDRFRSGTMPIGIADYQLVNQISVYAPELDGLWKMTPIPGTLREDGSIDCSVTSLVTGCGILKSEKLDESWEFLKWWVSSSTQTKYSQEIEVVLGVAGRNPTANFVARNQLGWSRDNRINLNKQAESLIGIPEVPGGYYVSRNFGFAFNNVVYQGKNVIEAISDMIKESEAEIATKTEELLIRKEG